MINIKKVNLSFINKCFFTSILLIVLAVTGCSSQVKSTYYQISTGNERQNSSEPKAINKSIWLNNIDIAEYLNQQGIVYQINPFEYAVANNNFWLSPLTNQMRFSLQKDLSILLPDFYLSNDALPNTEWTISLKIEHFNGDYQGYAVFSGQWILTKVDYQPIVKPFYCQQPLQSAGYESLVKALSTCVLQQEKDVANLIINSDS